MKTNRFDEDLNDHADDIICHATSELKSACRWLVVFGVICVVLLFVVGILFGTLKDTIAKGKEYQRELVRMTDTISTLGNGLSRSDTIIIMATAFAMQETKCHNIDSPDGKYVGYLQMSEIAVREVNRILGEDMFTYEDRHNWECCVAMFGVIMEDKNPTLDIDKAIDIWNKRCPKVYRNQVKTYYKFLLEKTF